MEDVVFGVLKINSEKFRAGEKVRIEYWGFGEWRVSRDYRYEVVPSWMVQV